MTKRDVHGEDPIRDAADEIRRESRNATAEVRFELGAAGRETRDAIREAMEEMREAFSDIWGAADPEPSSTSSARLTRAERKELTRELLLDAAIDVFAKKGYHGASLDDVAEAAGFTKGAVYSNFTRKSDLFKALLERETRRRGTALTQSIDAVPYRFLPEVVGEWLRRQSSEQRDWDILNIEFSLAAARDPSLRPALRRAMDDFGAVLERKLGSADAKAEFTGRELATILDALATGLLMEQYLDPEGGQPELFTKAVRKLLAERPGEGANGS